MCYGLFASQTPDWRMELAFVNSGSYTSSLSDLCNYLENLMGNL